MASEGVSILREEDIGEENLAPIEVTRNQRMKENAEKLKQLGLADVDEELRKMRRESSQGWGQLKKRKRAILEPIQIRKSARVRKQTNYFEYTPELEVRERVGRKTRTRAKKTVSCRGDRFEGWHPLMSQASETATQKAVDAAIRYLEDEDLTDCGGLKRMSQSMVSGGFWCSLERDFGLIMDRKGNGKSARYYFNKSLADYKRMVYLHVVDAPTDDKDKFGVVLLGKGAKKKDVPTAYGFSGGWRGFAIEQLLYPGDVVAMWRQDDYNIGVKIFRGMEFETKQKKNVETKQKQWKQGDILLKWSEIKEE